VPALEWSVAAGEQGAGSRYHASMHVFASLEGHGARLVPRAPFRLARAPSIPCGVGVEWTREDGTVLGATVIPDEASCRLEPADGPADLLRLPGAPAGWRIATTAFTLAWPSGLVVQSSPNPDTPPGFDFVAPGDVLLWPQGVFPRARLGGPMRLAGPGQRMVNVGSSSRRWRRRPWVRPSPWRRPRR